MLQTPQQMTRNCPILPAANPKRAGTGTPGAPAGKPAPILRTNYAIRSVIVPAR